MKKLILALLLLGVMVGRVWGAEYYVDATLGDDSNPGTQAEPWKTLSGSLTVSSGDTVYLKRGEEWRESLSATDGVTYKDYGSGNKPLLLGSLEANDTNDWTESGTADVWKSQKGITGTLGSELMINGTFDSDATNWAAYFASVVGASGSFARTTTGGEYYSGAGGGKLTVTDSGDSGSHVQLYSDDINLVSGNWYKLSFAIKSTNKFTTSDINIIKDSSPYTSYIDQSLGTRELVVGSDWYVHSIYFKSNTNDVDARLDIYLGGVVHDNTIIYIDEVSIKQIDITDGSVLTSDVGNIIFNEEESCGIKKQSDLSLASQGDFFFDLTASNVLVYSTSNPASFYSDIELAFRNTGVTVASNTNYENLDIRYFDALGIGSSNKSNVNVTSCDLSYIGGGDQYSNYTVRYGNAIQFWIGASNIVVEKCRIDNIYDAGLTTQGSGTDYVKSNIIFRNNIVTNCEYSIEHWESNASVTIDEVVYANNTCKNAGGGWSHGQRWDGNNGRHLMLFTNNATMTSPLQFKNNIFDGATESAIRMSVASDYTDYDFDNNIFNCDDVAYVSTTTYSTLSEWQAASSQDANSIATDPLLRSDNIHLLRGSDNPCYGAGVALDSVTDDYDGQARDLDNPTIGADYPQTHITFEGVRIE